MAGRKHAANLPGIFAAAHLYRVLQLVFGLVCSSIASGQSANPELLHAHLPLPSDAPHPERELVPLQRSLAPAAQANAVGDLLTPRGASYHRRLRGEGLPPFILKLNPVLLATARGSDRFHSYVTRIEHAIAKSLGRHSVEVQGVALLVYKDHTVAVDGKRGLWGWLVLLFVVDFTSCSFNVTACHATVKQDWWQSLRNSSSPVNQFYQGQVDTTFPVVLTPHLCDQWEIQGPGCNSARTSGPYAEDQRGLPLWFVFGLGAMSMLLCAIFPVWRTMQVRARNRLPPPGLTLAPAVPWAKTSEALETELQSLKHDCVSLDSLQEDDTCPICLSQPADEISQHLLIPPCRHCMHVSCAKEWLIKHLQCPLCRRAFQISECAIWELQEACGKDTNRSVGATTIGASCSSSASPSEVSDAEIPDQHAAVAAQALRILIDDIKTELEEVKRDLVDHCRTAVVDAINNTTAEVARGDATEAATSVAAVDGREATNPAPRNYTMSDPRSPIMRVSMNATVLGSSEESQLPPEADDEAIREEDTRTEI